MLCFNYAGDWELLVDLVGEVPPGWQVCQIGEVIDFERMETYFREHGGRHHALHDARANRFAMRDQSAA